MSRITAAVLAGAAMLLLAACEDQPRHEPANIRNPNVYQELSYARGEGPVLLVVTGEAFPGANAAERRATLEAVQGGPPGANVIFTLDPNEAGQTERQLVIGFNASTGLSGQDLCAGGEASGAPPADGTVTLTAAFCRGGSALSEIRGEAPDLRGPADRQFEEWVRVAMRELFPRPER